MPSTTPAKAPPKKKKKRVVDDDDDSDDGDWKPGGSDDDEEEEEDGIAWLREEDEYVDDDDDEDEPLSSRKRGKRPAPKSASKPPKKNKVAAKRSSVSAATQQNKPKNSRGGSAAGGSSSSAPIVIDCTIDADAELAAQMAAEEEDGAAEEEEDGEEEWCDTSTHTGTYTAEYARSGRAKCKICGEIIALRELRIGIEAEEKGWGIITRWQHVACTRLPRMIATDPENLLEGYDKLTVPDQVSSVSSHHLLPSHHRPPTHYLPFFRPSLCLIITGDRQRDAECNRPAAHLRPVDPDEEIIKGEKWTTQREPPDNLLAPMLPYQKEGLGWLCKQEDSDMRGGILADEMGMGKTLQVLKSKSSHQATQAKQAAKKQPLTSPHSLPFPLPYYRRSPLCARTRTSTGRRPTRWLKSMTV